MRTSQDQALVASYNYYSKGGIRFIAALCLVLASVIFIGCVIVLVYIFEYNQPIKYAVICFMAGMGGLYLTSFTTSVLLISKERLVLSRKEFKAPKEDTTTAGFTENDTLENLNTISDNSHVVDLDLFELPRANIRKSPPPPYNEPENKTGLGKFPTVVEEAQHQDMQGPEEIRRMFNIMSHELYKNQGGHRSQEQRIGQKSPAMAAQRNEYITQSGVKSNQQKQTYHDMVEKLNQIQDPESFLKAFERLGELYWKVLQQNGTTGGVLQQSSGDSPQQRPRQESSAGASPLKFSQSRNRSPLLALQQNSKSGNPALMSRSDLDPEEQPRTYQSSPNPERRPFTTRANLVLPADSQSHASQPNMMADGTSYPSQLKNSDFSLNASLTSVNTEHPRQMSTYKSLSKISQPKQCMVQHSGIQNENVSVLQKAMSFGSLSVNASKYPSDRLQLESTKKSAHPDHMSGNVSKSPRPGQSTESVLDSSRNCKQMTPQEWITAWNRGFQVMQPNTSKKIVGARL